jgi:hypothetical protein
VVNTASGEPQCKPFLESVELAKQKMLESLYDHSSSATAPGHSVVMKSITQRTLQRVNGQLAKRLTYTVMNPAHGVFTNISRKSIMNAHKIFLINRF